MDAASSSELIYPALTWIGIYSFFTLLFFVFPGEDIDGYVPDPNNPSRKLRYRLNGLAVFLLTTLSFCCACAANWLPWDLFYTYRWYFINFANIVGLIGSIYFYIRGDRTLAAKSKKNDLIIGAPWAALNHPNALIRGLARFFFGQEANVHWDVFDVKMYLYLSGAIVLMLNIISFAAEQAKLRADGTISIGTTCYIVLFGWFLVEYLWHEHVHVYTWDFVGENTGFKLWWGCFVVFGYFYPVGMWTIVDNPNFEHPTYILVIAVICFFLGWVLCTYKLSRSPLSGIQASLLISFVARGANNQKWNFKTNPNKKFLGIEQRTVRGRVLVSGWWGLARHVNYLGDTLMSVGLALCADYTNPIAWLYTIYYVILFTTRERDDDWRCEKKYGAEWEEYRKRVPYRMIPWVY